MSIEDFYKKIGGSYEELLSAYKTNERIFKYLSYFIDDTTYQDLCTHISNTDYASALDSAHTLKGVALNLGFKNLAYALNQLRQDIKENQFDAVRQQMDSIHNQYTEIIAYIKNNIMSRG